MVRRLRTIAKYINEAHAGKLQARVVRGYYDTDRKYGRIRWPGKGRHGNRIIVTDVVSGEVVLDHNAAETYRSNAEVEEWLNRWERSD